MVFHTLIGELTLGVPACVRSRVQPNGMFLDKERDTAQMSALDIYTTQNAEQCTGELAVMFHGYFLTIL